MRVPVDSLQRRLEPQETWHDNTAKLNKRLFLHDGGGQGSGRGRDPGGEPLREQFSRCHPDGKLRGGDRARARPSM